MDTEELEALNLLHYNSVDVDVGVLAPPFPVVHDQLLCLADIEGEVVFLEPHFQVIRRTTVVLADLMMMLRLCTATQFWVKVNREYTRGLSTHP